MPSPCHTVTWPGPPRSSTARTAVLPASARSRGDRPISAARKVTMVRWLTITECSPMTMPTSRVKKRFGSGGSE
jgi:hypothetical protein